MNYWLLSFALLLAFLSGMSLMCSVATWAIGVHDWRSHAIGAALAAGVCAASTWLLVTGA